MKINLGIGDFRLCEGCENAIFYQTDVDFCDFDLVQAAGETGKVVIEDVRCTAPFRPDAPTAEEAAFLGSLAVSGLPRGDLFALYQGWLDRVAALEAARITGWGCMTRSL